MRTAHSALLAVAEKTKDENYVFERLYRQLYNPDLYRYVAGVRTAAEDGQYMEIAEAVKERRYKPGQLPEADAIVAGAIDAILRAAYAIPPNRKEVRYTSLETALKTVATGFEPTRCYVVGRAKPKANIKMLDGRIKDERLKRLVQRLLDAGQQISALEEIAMLAIDRLVNKVMGTGYARHGTEWLIGLEDRSALNAISDMKAFLCENGGTADIQIVGRGRKAYLFGHEITTSKKTGKPMLRIPPDAVRGRLLKLGVLIINKSGAWKSKARGWLTNKPDHEITETYNRDIIRMARDYRYAANKGMLSAFHNIMHGSMLKTLAAKYKCQTSVIKKKLGSTKPYSASN